MRATAVMTSDAVSGIGERVEQIQRRAAVGGIDCDDVERREPGMHDLLPGELLGAAQHAGEHGRGDGDRLVGRGDHGRAVELGHGAERPVEVGRRRRVRVPRLAPRRRVDTRALAGDDDAVVGLVGQKLALLSGHDRRGARREGEHRRAGRGDRNALRPHDAVGAEREQVAEGLGQRGDVRPGVRVGAGVEDGLGAERVAHGARVDRGLHVRPAEGERRRDRTRQRGPGGDLVRLRPARPRDARREVRAGRRELGAGVGAGADPRELVDDKDAERRHDGRAVGQLEAARDGELHAGRRRAGRRCRRARGRRSVRR